MSGHHYWIASRARNPSLTEFPRAAAREGSIKVTTIVTGQQTLPSSLKCSRLAMEASDCLTIVRNGRRTRNCPARTSWLFFSCFDDVYFV
jgi:hypothetical protein